MATSNNTWNNTWPISNHTGSEHLRLITGDEGGVCRLSPGRAVLGRVPLKLPSWGCRAWRPSALVLVWWWGRGDQSEWALSPWDGSPHGVEVVVLQSLVLWSHGSQCIPLCFPCAISWWLHIPRARAEFLLDSSVGCSSRRPRASSQNVPYLIFASPRGSVDGISLSGFGQHTPLRYNSWVTVRSQRGSFGKAFSLSGRWDSHLPCVLPDTQNQVWQVHWHHRDGDGSVHHW